MLHRLTYLLALSTAVLAGCGSNEHCIGDCEPQTTSSDTAGPVTSTEGGTSTTASGGTTTAETTTAEATTADDPTTSIPGSTSTAAEDFTTTGAEGQMICREGIFCMVQCMIQVPNPPPPDYPLDQCLFTHCLDKLSPAEMLKLQELQECAEDECGATDWWECIDGTDECMACFLQIMSARKDMSSKPCPSNPLAASIHGDDGARQDMS